jgi:hypothetical protein
LDYEEKVMTISSELLVVSVAVDQSVEDRWNDWYDREHLPEIAACPGFRSAQRFVSEAPSGERHYLTIYEIEGPAALESSEFMTRRGWGPFADKVNFSTRRYRPVAR